MPKEWITLPFGLGDGSGLGAGNRIGPHVADGDRYDPLLSIVKGKIVEPKRW